MRLKLRAPIVLAVVIGLLTPGQREEEQAQRPASDHRRLTGIFTPGMQEPLWNLSHDAGQPLSESVPGQLFLSMLLIVALLQARRTVEFVLPKERAEVANNAESTFLASTSHELRAPLNAVPPDEKRLHRIGEYLNVQRGAQA